MLTMMGFSEDEMDNFDLGEMTDEEISEIIFDKIKAKKVSNGNGPKKKIVSAEEGRYLIEKEDWDLITELNTGEWILRPPM